ncbi:MAG: membrane protein insertase YidC, partial [Rheinheimera sp.]|nr:membrane protein insertase YidC [Rheinheimera sp.]
MESQRSLLVIGLALVSFLLWQQWNIDTAPKPVTPVTETSQSTGSSSADLQLTTADSEQVTTVAATARTISVKTDVLDVKIDSRGGDIVALQLPAFELHKGAGDAYPLMRQQDGFEYVAQSGLIGRDGPDDARNARPVYMAEQSSYQLADGATELVVPLLFNHNGMMIEKRFIFTAGQYDVRVEYSLHNQSAEVKTVQPYQHLVQTMDNGQDSSMMMPVYRGTAYGTAAERY